MAVESVAVQLDVPKESKEVVDAVTGLVSHFVKGGDLSGAAAFLPAVMAAVDGYEKLADELGSELKHESAAYAAWKLWEALEKPAEAEGEQPQA